LQSLQAALAAMPSVSVHLEPPLRPSTFGSSLLSDLGCPLRTTSPPGGLTFDAAPVFLAETAAGVHLSLAEPSAPCQRLPLGRQTGLWAAIPGLRQGALDPEKTVRAAAVVLLQDDSGAVLVTRRAASMRTYPGCWVLPGGAVDEGESLAAAAAREVLEETGLVVDAASLVPLAAWESAFPLSPAAFEAAGGVLRAHTLMVAFAGRCSGVAPRLQLQPAEVDVAVWLPAADVAALLAGELQGELPAAAAEGLASQQVRSEQLCGVYPNELPAPEGLGLAHHFTLHTWLGGRL